MLDNNLKQNCKEVHGKASLVKNKRRWRSVQFKENLPKGKNDNEENLDSS